MMTSRPTVRYVWITICLTSMYNDGVQLYIAKYTELLLCSFWCYDFCNKSVANSTVISCQCIEAVNLKI